MKKKIALLLAGLMVITLCACGQTGNTSESFTEKAENATGDITDEEKTVTDSKTETISVDFPKGNKQINIIVPYAAGGVSDATMRVFAPEFEKGLGATVTISNITGASGIVGLTAAQTSAADGYTLAYVPVELTMFKSLGQSNLGVDDFDYVCRIYTAPTVLSVRADSGFDTLEDFVNYAKEHPGEITVGNSGAGGIMQLGAASLAEACGIEVNHVPFNEGIAGSVAAVLGGTCDACVTSPSDVVSYVQSGDFKVLASMSENRSSALPEVPTASELGYDVTCLCFGGLAVPKGTPQEVIDILAKAAKAASESDAMLEFYEEHGTDLDYLDSADFAKYLHESEETLGNLITELGINES